MEKMLFSRAAELARVDGPAEKFEAGKAYWLRADQAQRWRRRGMADTAPADMVAENEKPAPSIGAPDVMIERTSDGRYNVTAHGRAFNPEPLSADEAEKLRQRVLAGDVKMPQAEPPAVEPVEPAADEPPAPESMDISSPEMSADEPPADEPPPEQPEGRRSRKSFR